MSIKGIKGKKLQQIMALAASNNLKIVSTKKTRHFKIKAQRPDGSIGTITMSVSPSDHRTDLNVKHQWRAFAQMQPRKPEKD